MIVVILFIFYPLILEEQTVLDFYKKDLTNSEEELDKVYKLKSLPLIPQNSLTLKIIKDLEIYSDQFNSI
jgi:hypothetical protein